MVGGGSSETRGGTSGCPEDSRGEETKETLHKGGCSKKCERLSPLQARVDITGLLSPTGVLQKEFSWSRKS